MPSWISRETVYLAWLAVTSVGLVGIALSRFGLRFWGAVVLAAYGAFGLDGLAHYTLALCSEHTLAMNVTIWAEAGIGLLLALCSAVFASRLLSPVPCARLADAARQRGDCARI